MKTSCQILDSYDAEKLFKSWNVTVRNVFMLDRKTHRCLIEPLSNHLHLKVMLLQRFLKFHQALISSPKFTVRYLARLITNDMRTTAGRTLSFLENQCKVKKGAWQELSGSRIKSKLMYASPNPGEEWKLSLASNLLQIRMGNSDLLGFTSEEIDDLLHFVCTK